MADRDFLWPFLMLLLRSDSREMTGKHCVERRRSGSGKKNTRWDSNSGHCERSYAECRHTNYKAIGAEAHGDFCAEISHLQVLWIRPEVFAAQDTCVLILTGMRAVWSVRCLPSSPAVGAALYECQCIPTSHLCGSSRPIQATNRHRNACFKIQLSSCFLCTMCRFQWLFFIPHSVWMNRTFEVFY